MLTKEELKEFSVSVEILSDECNKHDYCSTCGIGDFCALFVSPENWKIPKEDDNKILQAAAVVKAVCSKFHGESCADCPLCETCNRDICEWEVFLDD
jgi:hypothetical protein